MASNLVYMLHAVADYIEHDKHTVAIAWTILVVMGVTTLLVVTSRETEEEKQRNQKYRTD